MEELILSGAHASFRTRGRRSAAATTVCRQLTADYIDHLAVQHRLRPGAACGCWWTAPTARPAPPRRTCSAASKLHGGLHPHGSRTASNINNGCGSTHLEALAAARRAPAAMTWASPSTATPTAACWWTRPGHAIDGDKVMAVCALDMKRTGKLTGNAVVATVMSQPGPARVLPGTTASTCVCTDVGDRNVLEKMLERGYAHRRRAVGPHDLHRRTPPPATVQLTALQFLQILAPGPARTRSRAHRRLPAVPPGAA